MPNISRQLQEDGTCILTFDRPDSPANIFDRETLEELAAHLHAIAQPEQPIKALLLRSAKPSIFVAGADLRALQKMSREEMQSFIELGQNTFAAITALTIPTVAAIHGACVGGGLECALACDWRVASDDHSTKIGLPETKLGILPAWGGSMRLPRLLGAGPALHMILAGQTVGAVQALKRGLVDAVVPPEHLLEAAQPWLRKGKRARPHLPVWEKVSAPFISGKARSEALKKTRGHYPAIVKAAEVAVRAAAASTDAAGLALEREAVLDLAASTEAARLIGLFFLQERAKKLTIRDAPASKERVRSVAVIGAGVMGSAIAQWISARGLSVTMRDVDAERVAFGMGNIAKLYEAGVKKHLFSKREARDGIDRVSPVVGEVPLHHADLVLEAAVEKMPIKKTIFQQLDRITREDAILATNTSALSISELARATRHPERVLGLHFFNPVHQMQLVEVITAPETSPAVAARGLRFVQGLGKLPVLVKDSPGFLVNRILLPYMIEAGELFAAGANPKEIDAAMLDFGMPMGPIRLTDEVGVDVAAEVSGTLAAAFPQWIRVPEILPKMVAAGLLGRKAGKGFYRYGKGEPIPSPEARALQAKAKAPLSREALAQRMALLMVNEAARCLEEGIVGSAADVDFAMVMGTGFAPFRGGPLRYADALGTATVVEQLEKLSEAGDARFRPCALLIEKAKNRERFYET